MLILSKYNSERSNKTFVEMNVGPLFKLRIKWIGKYQGTKTQRRQSASILANNLNKQTKKNQMLLKAQQLKMLNYIW